MASIKDVIDAFDTAVDGSSFFQQFVADDLDSINEDSKNSYPYLALVPVSDTLSNPRAVSSTATFEINLFAANTQFQGDGEERPTRHTKWDEMRTALIDLFNSLTGVSMTPDDITFTYGHAAHNDDLVVVQASFSVIAFDTGNC